MTIEEVFQNLCVHDPRNPFYKDLHYGDEPGDIPLARNGCACDSCFYGRDKLALRILELENDTADIALIAHMQGVEQERDKQRK